MNFRTAASFLLLSNFVVAEQEVVDENCAPIEQLGTPSLERYNYSISMVGTIWSVRSNLVRRMTHLSNTND